MNFTKLFSILFLTALSAGSIFSMEEANSKKDKAKADDKKHEEYLKAFDNYKRIVKSDATLAELPEEAQEKLAHKCAKSQVYLKINNQKRQFYSNF